MLFTRGLALFMRIVFGKLFHLKMIDLQAGLKEFVNCKLMHIKYNMVGMQFQ
jgi:hypothetical protein